MQQHTAAPEQGGTTGLVKTYVHTIAYRSYALSVTCLLTCNYMQSVKHWRHNFSRDVSYIYSTTDTDDIFV